MFRLPDRNTSALAIGARKEAGTDIALANSIQIELKVGRRECTTKYATRPLPLWLPRHFFYSIVGHTGCRAAILESRLLFPLLRGLQAILQLFHRLLDMSPVLV